jgi:hypothetical protein
MGQGGVDAIRLMAHWGTVEPTPGERNWGTLDALVRETTARGIQPLFVLYGPPEWAAHRDGNSCAGEECAIFAPRSNETQTAYANFARDLVQRYGPGGDFWTPAACGCTVAQPIRMWQLWNEQNSPKYYAPKVNAKEYAKLVAKSSKAIKSVDRKAEVMLGGMWGPESLKRGKKKPPVTTYIDYMKRLYKVRGIKKRFESLALHPYSSSVGGMIKQLREARRVAKSAGDRKVGLWITEIGWASGGPPDEPYVKGDEGQAKLLENAYRKLERKRRSLRFRGVFWYSWRDRPGGDLICAWCGNAGLLNADGSPKPAWDAFVRMASG